MRFHQSRTCGLTKRKIDLHFWIYFIICMIAVYLTCAMPVHASLGYYEVQDLYQTITDNVKEANDLLNKAFAFAKVSPFTILNSASGSIGDNVKTASKTAALSIATLLLMVDFFRKSVTFEWSSRWENILIFLVKVLVIKQVVQNTDVIMDNIYSGLDFINQKALAGGTVNFLPCGEMSNGCTVWRGMWIFLTNITFPNKPLRCFIRIPIFLRREHIMSRIIRSKHR